MGAVLGNLAGILAIVTGALAAVFNPQLVAGSPHFSPGLAGVVLALSVVTIGLFVAGCAVLLRDTRRVRRAKAEADAPARPDRPETLIAQNAGAMIGGDGRKDQVTRSYAPREPFILGLPAAALGLAAVGLVLELLGLVDVLPSRVIPLASALVLAFGAFTVVRRLQLNLARARVTSLFTRAAPADQPTPREH